MANEQSSWTNSEIEKHLRQILNIRSDEMQQQEAQPDGALILPDNSNGTESSHPGPPKSQQKRKQWRNQESNVAANNNEVCGDESDDVDGVVGDPRRKSKKNFRRRKKKTRKKVNQMQISEDQHDITDNVEEKQFSPLTDQEIATLRKQVVLPDENQVTPANKRAKNVRGKNDSIKTDDYESSENFKDGMATVKDCKGSSASSARATVEDAAVDIDQDKDLKDIPSTPSDAEKFLNSFDLVKLDSLAKTENHSLILAVLKAQHIYPLRKKSRRYPKANYFCHLCDYHLDGLFVCKRHLSSPRHIKLHQSDQLDVTLRQLPSACVNQSEAIETILKGIVDRFGLKQEDIENRIKTVQILNEILSKNKQIPDGCKVEHYGSSASGVGFRNCDLNINLYVRSDPSINPALVFKSTFETINQCTELYEKVSTDWSAKIPTISFVDKSSGRYCVMVLNNSTSCQTTNLIKDYVAFDPRVRILCTGFRYWAKICNVDRQQEGTLPPHAFDLLVIYFLQQLKLPVLPVLHEIWSEKHVPLEQVAKTWKTKNNTPVGNLWVELFRFLCLELPHNGYVVCVRESKPVTTTKKNWRGRKLAIEDPYATKRNLARSVTSQKVYDYILTCFKLSFKYFGIPQTSNGPLFDSIDRPVSDYINMFDELVIGSSKRDKKTQLNNEPSRSKAIPATNSSGKDLIDFGEEPAVSDDLIYFDKADLSSDSKTGSGISDTSKQRLDSTVTNDSDEDIPPSSSSGDDDDDDNESSEEEIQGGAKKDAEKSDEVKKPEKELRSKKKMRKVAPLPTPPDILQLIANVKKEDYIYDFVWKLLTGGQDPVIECASCQKEGHLKKDCPDETLPPLEPLPPPDWHFIKIISDCCKQIERAFRPSASEIDERQGILRMLTEHIRSTFPDAVLELFGSSCNGFGFSRSDLDICMTFKNGNNSEDFNVVDVILKLAEVLKKCKAVFQVIAIPTAKVPIVKFTHFKSKLECDISLSNTLARHNTRMLNAYACIDPRVKTLGYTMKYFAKMCEIGDASRGSLSSYAYTLMVIYFLQQRNPPVIPVLQELHGSNDKPENIVDGWNAWFYEEDLANFHKVWPGLHKNKESVGQLWLGLLRFYMEEFNFKEQVISIRQHQILTRFEKLWNSKSIAIEDPFDLSHNLGSGVSRKMNTYIMKAFRKGRLVFGRSLPREQCNFGFSYRYLFDPKLFTDGPPPNDRCCHYCRRIGHIMRDCPRREANKERIAKLKMDKERQAQRAVNEAAMKLNVNLVSGVPLQSVPKEMHDDRLSKPLNSALGLPKPRHQMGLIPINLTQTLPPSPNIAEKKGMQRKQQNSEESRSKSRRPNSGTPPKPVPLGPPPGFHNIPRPDISPQQLSPNPMLSSQLLQGDGAAAVPSQLAGNPMLLLGVTHNTRHQRHMEPNTRWLTNSQTSRFPVSTAPPSRPAFMSNVQPLMTGFNPMIRIAQPRTPMPIISPFISNPQHSDFSRSPTTGDNGMRRVCGPEHQQQVSWEMLQASQTTAPNSNSTPLIPGFHQPGKHSPPSASS